VGTRATCTPRGDTGIASCDTTGDDYAAHQHTAILLILLLVPLHASPLGCPQPELRAW